jgi:hypothetical protein
MAGLRFDTAAHRFCSILLIVGLPAFVLQSLWRWHEVAVHPELLLAIGVRDLWQTAFLWLVNEALRRIGKST